MPTARSRQVWLYAIIIAVCACITFAVSADARVVLHSVVNVFATGRTGVKTFIFMLYVIVIAAVIYVRSGVHVDAKAATFWRKILFSSALSAYALNFATYLWVMKLWHIPLFTYSLVYSGGAFTSLQFIHNHVTKGAIGVIAQFLPAGALGHLDSGAALLGMIPDSIFYLQALLVAITVVGVYMLWYHIAPKIGEMKLGRSALYVMMLALSSFMVLKSLLDGGFLSFESIIGLSFLYLLLVHESRTSQRMLVATGFSYFALLAILYWFGYFATDANYGYHSFSAVTAFLLLSALYALYTLGRTRLSMLVLVMAAIPFCVQVYNGLTVFEYRTITIEKGDTASVFSYNEIAVSGFVKKDTVGNIRLYSFSPESETSIGDIVPYTGFSDNMTPVSVAWKTCIPPAPPSRYVFKVVSPNRMDAMSENTSLYRMEAVAEDDYGDGFYRYSVAITAHPCSVPQLIVFVQEILAKHLGKFALYDIQQFENGE